MDLCYCEKCHKWFDINDEYDAILIAKKINEGYEMLHFCQKCGEQIHDAITAKLNESEDTDNE